MAYSPDHCRPTPDALSIHRAPAIRLPQDPVTAAALVRQLVLSGDSSCDRSAAIEAMNQRLALLKSADGQQVLEELAAQASICDALFQRWTAEAIASKVPDYRAKFMKLALASQASYTRSMLAIEGIQAQRKGRAVVTVHPDDDTGHEDDAINDR